jgi:hypothetical protein
VKPYTPSVTSKVESTVTGTEVQWLPSSTPSSSGTWYCTIYYYSEHHDNDTTKQPVPGTPVQYLVCTPVPDRALTR